jgi:glycosyltransferase involved in cell wall biosynthesis
MDKRLSIIIPVYNAELFLEKCLHSCADQDIQPDDYEIIVINDGSTDNSAHIINSVKADYSNFVFIDKQNGGVSSARNVGLDIAKGEYVWFVDADDWIETNCLAFLLDIVKNNNLDALQFNAKEVTITGNISPSYLINQTNSPILSPEKYLKEGYFEGYAHMTLSRKYIIDKENIRFKPGIKMREDLLFHLELVSNVEKIQRLNITPYYYCLREFSASALHDSDSNIPLLNEINKLNRQDVLRDYNKWLIPDYIYDHINQNIFNIDKLIEELKYNGYNRIIFSSKSKLKVMLFFTIYNINLYMALYIFYFIKKLRKHFKRTLNHGIILALFEMS